MAGELSLLANGPESIDGSNLQTLGLSIYLRLFEPFHESPDRYLG